MLPIYTFPAIDFKPLVSGPTDDVTWTEERVAELTRLYLAGYTCRYIAAHLGGVTKSAVISKTHTLGLAGQRRASNPCPLKPGRRARVPARIEAAVDPDTLRQRLRATSAVQRINAMPKSVPIDVPPSRVVKPGRLPPEPDASCVPVEQRCSLAELSRARCRWPIGEPGREGFAFCGAAPYGSESYCTHHAGLAYPGRRVA